jgi:hypothetical protein
LAIPPHLVAGGGSPGRNRGAKSKEPTVIDAVSRAGSSLWEFADR